MSRLRALFDRYYARHFRLSQTGMPLPGPEGHLDRIIHAKGRIVLEGWSEADAVAARSAGHETAKAPSLSRQDVKDARGLREDVGFRLELPMTAGAVELQVLRGNDRWSVPIPGPSWGQISRAKARVQARFLRDLVKAGPHLPKALMSADPTARARVKTCLGLDDVTSAGRDLETRLFDCAGLPQGPWNTPITIILPVYNAFDLLCEALENVVAHTDLPWHLILVEDASPDTRVRPYLRDWAGAQGDRVTLLENRENLGFIGSVNRGLSVAIERGEHAVLLNSDAFVPPGWASRLLRPIACHENVASVTPMSNDATILTAPVIARRSDISKIEAVAADNLAQSFNPEALLSVLPTGVGFCMAMNIAFLRAVPRLDSAFGRGYGEEVDWCQRTKQRGGRHLGLPGLFVEHRGGESFGSEAKRALVRKNNKIISGRYPQFDTDVARFIARDPMATARLAIGLAMIDHATDLPIPIYVAHSMGGGAESYVQNRIQGDLLRGLPSVVLRVGGRRRWRIELHHENGETVGETDDFAFVTKLLAPISRRHIVYSCGVGDQDPAALPDLILSLVREGSPDRLDVLFHDYFPLSPSYTLLDHSQRYRGPLQISAEDKAHQIIRPNGAIVGLRSWRAAWGRLLLSAHRITVFSKVSKNLVASVYPWAEPRIEVIPHQLLRAIPRIEVSDSDVETIAVLGSIGAAKGARILSDLAQVLQAQADLRLVVIGQVDPSFELPADTVVTGRYRLSDLEPLAKHHRVTRWLIPSIWPETFSYVTHEALATGLPVHAFDLGAQGEAVTRAPNGVCVPFDPDGDLVAAILDSLPDRISRAA